MKLEKATIDILNGTPREPIRVLFNPFEYSIERANVYKATAVPGLSGPLIQFINGDADVLSMELFLDDYLDPPRDGRSVKDRLDDMALLLEIDPKLHAPPLVQFVWGRLTFKAIIEKLSRKITLFRPDGTPARATINVSFKEYKTLPELVNDPKLESADKSKRRVIVGRDSLWLLAAREYDDPALWTKIAEHNDLDDPRDIAPGDWVMVPPLDPADGLRGLL
jgi:nucleoid-associated protein YgaU